jgi:ABC-2 type transport system permease protein
MRNIWLIAVREFTQKIRSRGYIISSMAVPIFMVIFLAASSFSPTGEDQVPETEPAPGEEPVVTDHTEMAFGYVDEAGFIHAMPPGIPENIIQAYPDVEAASLALERGEIEAYYLIPDDYVSTGEIRRISLDLPMSPMDSFLIDHILGSNLLPEASPQEMARFQNPFMDARLRYVAITPTDPGGIEDPTVSDGPFVVGFSAIPLIMTFIIIMPLFTSGGYLLQSLGQEKNSRIMEILLNSLRPAQLLTGKLLGYGALTVVQYVFWIGISVIAFSVTGQGIGEVLGDINLSYQEVLYIVFFALGGYVLYSALMAGLGALAPNIEGGRSWVILITIPMMIPIYFWTLIVNAPDSPLAVGLSLFPFSAPVAMLMRLTSTTVPGWEIGASLGLLALTGAGTVWLMSRFFRVQTLLSGEAISIRRIVSVFRS